MKKPMSPARVKFPGHVFEDMGVWTGGAEPFLGGRPPALRRWGTGSRRHLPTKVGLQISFIFQ